MAETDMSASDSERASQSSASAVPSQPIIFNWRKTKKRKRKYSRGLREAQRLERGLSRASKRVSSAVADGLSTYHKRSEQSARKKRDGALRDALENWSEALGETVSKAAWAPHDIARRVGTRWLWP